MADFPAYEGAAPRCSGVAQPGVEAFMDWAVGDFRQGARNFGIYNCRSVRGSTNRSIHGDGRAGDVGFAMVGGKANPNGTVLLNTLLPHVRALGIQMIIWNRRIYSAKAPLGAAYQGVSPHTDHLHIEFTWNAARTLTRDRVRVIVGGPRIPAAETPKPAPAPIPAPPSGPSANDLLLVQQLLQEDDDMIVIRNGKGIAHLVNNRAIGLTAPQLVKVREAYRKANRPLPELTLDTDEQWRWYTGLG
jgi:hypothetical protein